MNAETHGNVYTLRLTFFTLPVVETQTNVDFNCTFSGCVGENVVCYCSAIIPNDGIHWNIPRFGNVTLLSNSNERTGAGLLAEVVNGSSSQTVAFTSKLTLNVSVEYNDTEIGCIQLQTNSLQFFRLLVTDCSESSGNNSVP